MIAFSHSRWGTRNLWLAFPIALAVLLPGVVAPQPARFEGLVSEGRQALASGEHQEALRAFSRGLEAASQVGDEKWQADFRFYLGLTLQTQAEDAGGSGEGSELLEEAAHHYEQALELQPGSGGAANNAAQIYSQLGMMDKAIEFYKKAAEAHDSRNTFYKLNLADLLTDIGQSERAIVLYESILEEEPENTRLHHSLTKLYLSERPEQLLPYLWRLIGEGLALRAQETALSTIGLEGWSCHEREELLTILVVTLSRQFYDPAQFEATDAGLKLGEIRENPDIRQGIGELMRLHHVGHVDANRFKWWPDRVEHWEEPERGMWPADAFRMLIRSLGDWCRQAGDLGSAENYYLLALTLDSEDPDPEAFVRLAELHIAVGNLAEVESIAVEYSPALFHGKAGAYRHSQARKIYKYHRALGIIYAHIGRWGGPYEPASAIFQLQHAIDTAVEFNRAAETTDERISLEPRVVGSLAEGYETTGDLSRAFETRVDAASVYLAVGDTAYAQQVLKPLVESGLPPSVSFRENARYEDLRDRAFTE